VLLGKTACEDRDMPNPDRMGGFWLAGYCWH
jgi:hypothetical protein